MFPDFAAMVESLAQEAGEEGLQYLPSSKTTEASSSSSSSSSSLEPWNIGYVASGGFLAPAFAGDNVATWAPPEYDNEDDDGTTTTKSSSAVWLDATQVRELEPNLHPDVIGGWWFPEDASVDAQRLTWSLKAACVGLGVEFCCGPNYEVSSLDLQDGSCQGMWLKSGKYVSTKSLVIANGSWMRNLLPVPLEPHKGQSLSLRMPQDRPPLLRRVLFAQDSYIVPKADGRIVIGATVEAGSFDANVTPAGIMHILSHAMQLVPGLADLPLEDTWAGLRPTTPDKGPILGETSWNNLYLAGGNWRNGVLLAPKTGQLIASLIASKSIQQDDPLQLLSEEDRTFLQAFGWDRFTSPEGAKRLAANSRYAASMYPVHTRRSGVGVAAAVGTELGSYSTARSAKDERKKDRESLFGSSSAFNEDDLDNNNNNMETEDAFERAAMLGRQDAAAFAGFEMKNGKKDQGTEKESKPQLPSLESTSSKSTNTMPYDGSADAFTVGFANSSVEEDIEEEEETNNSDSDLKSIYQSIIDNKSKQRVELPDEKPDDRPDPGFRIHHVDKESGEETEVPPYTTPGEFLQSLKKSKVNGSSPEISTASASSASSSATTNGENVGGSSGYDETTFDGYQAILDANSSTNRADELKAMKEARRKNRLGQTDIEYG